MRGRMPTSVSGEFWMEVERDGELHEVTVDYKWFPGAPPVVSGPADSWDPGYPDEVEIVSVWIDMEEIELTEKETKKAEDMALQLGGEQWAEMKGGDE